MANESGSFDDLYGLPLGEFIPARDALAKTRRAAGDKEGAAAAKALRKPTLAAWAMNQMAREHESGVAELLEAGVDLRAAQQDALDGDPTGLRDAGRTLNDRIQRLSELAAGYLDEASPVQRDRIAATLRAAATDDEAGDRLRRAVLVEDLDPAGFGLGGFEAAPAPRPGPAGGTSRKGGGRKGPDTEALEAARRELRRADAEAETAATTAHRRAERAEVAERRAVEAHREAEAARSEAEDAAAEAEAAHRRAREAAERLTGLE